MRGFTIVPIDHRNTHHLNAVYHIDSEYALDSRTLTQVRSWLARPFVHGCLAAEDLGDGNFRVLGYAVFAANRHEGDSAIIESLVVKPRYRRLGIGTALFKACAEFLHEGLPGLAVLTTLNNRVGLAFLKSVNDSVCDGAFGKFTMIDRERDVVRFHFAPCLEPA